MARHKYDRDEPTRRAVGPAARRLRPGRSLVGRGAVKTEAVQGPSVREGQNRVGPQAVQFSAPTAQSQRQGTGAWERLHRALGVEFKWPWEK